MISAHSSGGWKSSTSAASSSRREAKGRSPIPRDNWIKQHDAIIDALYRGEHARARELLRENRAFVLETKVAQALALKDAQGSPPTWWPGLIA